MAATDHALHLTQLAAQAAANKQATDLVAFDVSERLALTDVFLIVTAANERQVGAVADGIEEALHKDGSKVLRREGEGENRWVLLDFGDLVAHIQHAEERQLYSLERLWRDCPAIELRVDEAAAVDAS
ncbi:ribosome silencing factor [Propioniciclava sinopodophylli]|uniref:Ribosomal silencing factor RsfS n=1 Tax=Propioniciclava sinopodophylli TaxID=1837344 RepID=A0A4Q9KC29_9ACTN|nr:ribosome silencing factor [Propioniciclava sinopodophylli]TBT83715.1 ribosome silencing factor [Propioniciclava sinopodophylli]